LYTDASNGTNSLASIESIIRHYIGMTIIMLNNNQ
jgi:hypothetical protein